MPLKVTCPSCTKELKSPEHLAGKEVSCPRCGTNFRVPLLSDSEERVEISAAESPPGQTAGDAVATDQAGSPDTPRSASVAGVEAGRQAAGDTVATDQAGSPDTPRSTSVAGVEADRQAAVSPPGKPGAPRFRLAPPKIHRRAKRAEFIADETTAARVQLGADGQLPNLVLKDDQKQLAKDESARSSNPLLLIGVLCFGITISLIMLVVEPGGGGRHPQSKTEARQLIVSHYIGRGIPEPYQRKLREAIQAYHRGDYRTERARYRDVLNMLHDESIPEVRGLTGMRRDTKPPNDRHLEDLLAVLVVQD